MEKIFRAWCQSSILSEAPLRYTMSKEVSSPLHFEYFNPKTLELSICDFYVPFVSPAWVLEQFLGYNDHSQSFFYPMGQPIFEGDILKCQYEESEKAYFTIATFKNIQSICQSHHNVLIVGNIHENKDYLNLLLK